MHSDVMVYRGEGWTLYVNANKVRVKITLELPEESKQRFQEVIKNKFSFDVNEEDCYVTQLSALRPDCIKNLLDLLSTNRLITQKFATQIARSFPDGSGFIDLTDPNVTELGESIGSEVDKYLAGASQAEILALHGLMPKPVEKEEVTSNKRAFQI